MQNQPNKNINFSGIKVGKFAFNSINKRKTFIYRVGLNAEALISKEQLKKLNEMGLKRLAITNEEKQTVADISHEIGQDATELFKYLKEILSNAKEYTFLQIRKAKKAGTLSELLSKSEVLPAA